MQLPNHLQRVSLGRSEEAATRNIPSLAFNGHTYSALEGSASSSHAVVSMLRGASSVVCHHPGCWCSVGGPSSTFEGIPNCLGGV